MESSLSQPNLSSSHTKLPFITTLSFLFFCFLLTISIPISCSARVLQPQQSDTITTNGFIKTSCGVTLYPQLCYKTLIAYASTIQSSPMELANAALNISLKSVQSTCKTVYKLSKEHGLSHRDAGAIADCMEIMGDSVDEIKKSMVAMNDLDGPDFVFKMSNIQTWMSAALTDEDTCMDGFEGKAKNMDGHIKEAIRSCIVKVAQLTSISLALINKISYA